MRPFLAAAILVSLSSAAVAQTGATGPKPSKSKSGAHAKSTAKQPGSADKSASSASSAAAIPSSAMVANGSAIGVGTTGGSTSNPSGEANAGEARSTNR